MQMRATFFLPLFLLFEKRQWDAGKRAAEEQISTTTNFKVAEKITNKDFWVKMFEANSTELSPPCTDLRNKVSR